MIPQGKEEYPSPPTDQTDEGGYNIRDPTEGRYKTAGLGKHVKRLGYRRQRGDSLTRESPHARI